MVTAAESKQVGQFILDDLYGLKNLVLVSSTGDNHLAATENKAYDLGVIQSVNEARELLWLVFDLVEG
jgi:hypothetical protein